ncbi:MAG: hypothetical protein HDT37_06700 [Clostridiales bacterium]|nr:hypothetical protein [Clostridiales bacterium]
MGALFLKVLSMSATAALVILVVLLARLPLRRAPKVFSYALWTVVLFRLLCPFVIQTPWSFTPSIQVEAAGESLNMVEINMERVEGVIRVDDPPVIHSESTPSDVPAEPTGGPSAPGFSAWAVAGIVWLAGVAALLGYSLISLLLLRRKLVGSVPLEGEKDVRLADYIPSPFVLGLFRPNIYLPSNLPEGERDYILLHERTHIRRFDHLSRALAWLALAIHWFNPLVWLAFHLAGRDMEMSCDEAVLRKMGRDVRADYSTSLLRLSTGKRLPAGPLAFGDGDPTSRIKNVLSYKKPALWVIVIALIGVLCAGAALATDRMAAIRDLDFPAFDPDSVTADLTFSLDETDEELGPVVRINGTVGDVTLPRGAIWYSNGLWKEQQPGGELSMVYPAFTDGIEGHVTAWWADESRRSVTLSTYMTAVLSSYLPTGYWTFTVDVDSGTVIEMTPIGFTSIEGDESAEVRYYPTSISDEEAVKAARVAAKLLTAAEDYYNNGAPVQTAPANSSVLPEDDAWMEVRTATPTLLECYIGNQSGKALLFEEGYRLQTEVGGVWRDVEEETPMDFVASARVLDGSEGQLQLISGSFPVDVGSRYGELPPGHYRILKEAHLERELGREAVTLSAEFEIEE